MRNLSKEDIKNIKYIAAQGSCDINRTRLIKNLWGLSDEELQQLLTTYK